ncbi:MAG: exopolysaccharide biosynthesis protein [Betaproteobacteria bacterium]|nr:exopolysaccharide biosynthesis protein [Betaproteobacteria bacterium]
MVSKRLEQVRGIDPNSTVTLRAIDEMFGDDGAPLTIIFLCLPFLFPMPIPGISTAFGLAIILLTFRIVSPIALPLPRIADRIVLNGKTVSIIADKSFSYVVKIENYVKPRAQFMTSGLSRWLSALGMILSAVALALPIPPVIPLTNTLPALAITFFSLGLLMRDGLMIVLGHLMHLTSWAYFISVAGVAFSFALKFFDYIRPYIQG